MSAGTNTPAIAPRLLDQFRDAIRAKRPAAGGQVLRLGDATIDLEKRRAPRAGPEIQLTPIELRQLVCLAKHLGMVVTQRQLLSEVWGPAHAGDTHYLRIYMKQLREKFEADPVRPRHFITETGVGYRMMVDE